MARPKLKIDPEQVEKLAQLGCKTKEIATYFGCSDDTITGRFSAELAKGRSGMKMSLRRWQLEAAKKGNVTMLIWLGKQYLDQTEKIMEEVKADVNHKTDEEKIAELKSWLKSTLDKK